MNIISRILHLFSACFADYTHPREGTETMSAPRFQHSAMDYTHPREGTETVAESVPRDGTADYTHPREGTETSVLIRRLSRHSGLYSSPRGDGNHDETWILKYTAKDYTHPREGTETAKVLIPDPTVVDYTHPREGTETGAVERARGGGCGLYSSPRGDGNPPCMV